MENTHVKEKINLVYRLVDQHTKLQEDLVIITDIILNLAAVKEVNEIIKHTENRQRLVNVLELTQQKIEEIINHLSFLFRDLSGEKSQEIPEFIHFLKNWHQQFTEQVIKIDDKDREIVKLLENEKDETLKGLAAIFKNKENFRGYNLGNVKR